MANNRIYFVIDMKSFFASVECAERGLDAMTTPLVVADEKRTNKTICLAVTPALKKMGVKNRCRLFEIPDNINYIIAPPRMKKYIEYAAEIAIEHHLGLTCDPICGLVQIPCIERNAVAAMRAINAVSLASFLSDTRKISLDSVIHTMKETGLDIAHAYRETSEGGLAKIKL